MIKARRMTEQGDIILDDGTVISWDDNQSHIMPLAWAQDISLSSLRRVWSKVHGIPLPSNKLSQWETDDWSGVNKGILEQLYLSDVAPEEFDPEYAPVENVSLVYRPDGRLSVRLLLFINQQLDLEGVASGIFPLLRRFNASLLRIATEGAGKQIYYELDIEPATRGLPIHAAIELAQNVERLLLILHGENTVDLGAAWDVLETGHVDAFLGLPESSWLEAKSRLYDVSDDSEKVELAQDVSRFANSENGGLLLLGIRTRRNRDGESLQKVVGCSLPSGILRRYQSIIDSRVFPPIENLALTSVHTSRGDILAILVPAQPPELQPFLVHGATVAGKMEGAFISIVRRRGEQSIPISGPAIHSLLVAGRAITRASRSLRDDKSQSVD